MISDLVLATLEDVEAIETTYPECYARPETRLALDLMKDAMRLVLESLRFPEDGAA